MPGEVAGDPRRPSGIVRRSGANQIPGFVSGLYAIDRWTSKGLPSASWLARAKLRVDVAFEPLSVKTGLAAVLQQPALLALL